jgi:hypothetical protein
MMHQDSGGSYLNVGDVVLYGKFKNAKGRIKSFGKNEKGDPTIEVQPIDSDFKPKKGQPKTLTLLKVRKLPKKASAQRVVARFLQARGVARGKTWENGKIRVHRYANFFKVWDLANAGKRGKKVPVLAISPEGYRTDEEDWLERHSRHLVLKAGGGFAAIRRHFEGLEGDDKARIEERQERGIDVLPGGTRTIKVKWNIGTTEYNLEATPLSFSVTHSYLHTPSEEAVARNPRIKPFRQDTNYWSRKKADAKRFYAWLSGEGEGKLKRMEINDLRKLWNEMNVDFDSH